VSFQQIISYSRSDGVENDYKVCLSIPLHSWLSVSTFETKMLQLGASSHVATLLFLGLILPYHSRGMLKSENKYQLTSFYHQDCIMLGIFVLSVLQEVSPMQVLPYAQRNTSHFSFSLFFC